MGDVYDIRSLDISGKIYFRVLFEIGGKHAVLPAKMNFFFEIPLKERERIEREIAEYDWSQGMELEDRGWKDAEGNALVSVKYVTLEQKRHFIKTFDELYYNNVDISEAKQWIQHHGHQYGDFMKKPLYFDIEVDPTDMNSKWESGSAAIKFSNRVLMVGMASPTGQDYPIIEDDERKMLRVAFATAKKYSVLIGWNSGGRKKSFDIPYLQGRSDFLGEKLPWEKLPHLDAMYNYKDYMKFKKELGEVVHLGLDDAGVKFLGYGKTEKNYHKLLGWFLEDRLSLETYCMNDVYLMMDLSKQVKGLVDGFDVEVIKRRLATLEPNDRYVSSFVDSKFNDIAMGWKLGIPPRGKWLHRDPGKVCPFCDYVHIGDFIVEKCAMCNENIKKTGAGGLVIEPKKGLDFNTIFVDYYSLYPTIYMTHNIGVNTVDWDNIGEDTIKTEELNFFKEPKGLNAEFMEWMLVERKKYRDARDGYVKGTSEYIFNDMYQQAYKDILVSANGVLEQKNFRYKNQKIYNSCTKTGQVYLEFLLEAGEELGLELKQCDSVLPDTPVVIKRKDMVEIIPIEDLHYNYGTSNLRKPVNNVEIWTDSGWSDIKYVYRHKVQKKGYRILTDKGYVETTEDHSLVVDGVEVTPKELSVGDKIELYREKLPDNVQVPDGIAWTLGLYCADGTGRDYSNGKYQCRIANQNEELLKNAQKALTGIGIDCTIVKASDKMFYLDAQNSVKRMLTYFEMCQSKWGHRKIVPKCILNGTLQSKKSFLEGYLAGDGHIYENGKISFCSIDKSLLDGLCRILEDLGYDYYICIRKDKRNVLTVITRIRKPIKRKPRIIIAIEEFDIDGFVYDVETENHHFCGGVGGILLHNTDGIHFLSPYDTVEETIEHLKEIEAHLHKRVKEKAMAKWNIPEELYAIYPRCEKICSHFYSIAKKSYIMRIVYDDGKKVVRFDAKGMPGVKYNTLPLLKEILKNIFKEVIFKLPAGADYVDACVDYLLALKDDLYSGRRDDLLMFSQQVDKLGGRNPWDRAAEKLNDMGKFEPGAILKFIRRKNGSIILTEHEEVEVDLGTYEYYWTGSVASWIKRLLPVVAGMRELGFEEAMVNDTLSWLG